MQERVLLAPPGPPSSPFRRVPSFGIVVGCCERSAGLQPTESISVGDVAERERVRRPGLVDPLERRALVTQKAGIIGELVVRPVGPAIEGSYGCLNVE